jgi:hypothetical protein
MVVTALLLLIRISLALSKAIENPIININRAMSFKCYIFDRQHICPVWWTSISTDDGSDYSRACNPNGAPLLAGLFLHAYETNFLQGLFMNKHNK